jgi:hypothetical protein
VRDHVRLSIRPLDVPEEAATMARLMDHLGSDELLLWSSDWPHAHFEGDATVPQGLDQALLKKIMVDNPRATYSRLGAFSSQVESLGDSENATKQNPSAYPVNARE